MFPMFLLLGMKSDTENQLNRATESEAEIKPSDAAAALSTQLPLLRPAKLAAGEIIRIFGRQLKAPSKAKGS